MADYSIQSLNDPNMWPDFGKSVLCHISQIKYYNQNEEREPQINFTVIKICSSLLKLPELKVKYF